MIDQELTFHSDLAIFVPGRDRPVGTACYERAVLGMKDDVIDCINQWLILGCW